jgi:enamine deaminase RidA (YjgF/YER057c/UK114 family)
MLRNACNCGCGLSAWPQVVTYPTPVPSHFQGGKLQNENRNTLDDSRCSDDVGRGSGSGLFGPDVVRNACGACESGPSDERSIRLANYVDSVRVGNLLFLAGNTAGADWKFKGKVGKDINVQEGYETARQVGLIMLAKVQAALGFGDQPRVVNGFSDLMVEVFGEQIGKHARSAVGMQALSSNSAVEVEMIVEIE